jgi:hypothetical protein
MSFGEKQGRDSRVDTDATKQGTDGTFCIFSVDVHDDERTGRPSPVYQFSLCSTKKLGAQICREVIEKDCQYGKAKRTAFDFMGRRLGRFWGVLTGTNFEE